MQQSPPFLLRIKSDPFEILVPGARALLIFSCLLILLTGTSQNWYQYYLPALILIVTSLFLDQLMVNYKVPGLLLTSVAGLFILLATGNLIAPLCIICTNMLLKAIYKAPTVTIAHSGIIIKKTLITRRFNWQQFDLVIIKDNLLTLDFTSNQVMQLDIIGDVPDEAIFNKYCTEKAKTT